jgi:hypothetical protein
MSSLPVKLLEGLCCTTDVFIETGTWTGGGVDAALKAGFRRVITIESNAMMCSAVRSRFQDDERVAVIKGSSPTALEAVLRILNNKGRATIWLDAHGTVATNTGDERSYATHPEHPTTPLLDELRLLSRQKIRNHHILIDDRRRFHAWGITEEEVRLLIREINPDYEVTLVDSIAAPQDIIVASTRS